MAKYVFKIEKLGEGPYVYRALFDPPVPVGHYPLPSPKRGQMYPIPVTAKIDDTQHLLELLDDHPLRFWYKVIDLNAHLLQNRDGHGRRNRVKLDPSDGFTSEELVSAIKIRSDWVRSRYRQRQRQK